MSQLDFENMDTSSVHSVDQSLSGQTAQVALPDNARLLLQIPPAAEGASGSVAGGTGNGDGDAPKLHSSHERSDHSTYVRDVRGAFSGLPKIKPKWQDRYMTIMVCGESGLGKTTFIQNLFASYAKDPDLRVAGVPGATSRQVFESSPQQLCTTIDVEDPETQTRYHYSVQDTPGWENLGDTMENVIDHIQSRSLRCLENEQDARRLGPMHKIADPRVDVCLYFISPHRIKSIDVDFMAKLSKFVPVLPILAKADAMTKPELRAFRKVVQESLSAAKREAGRDIMYRFSEEALEEAGASGSVPPFAVVSSREMDASVGRYWPVRKYPWGVCEALSSDHSDVSSLKKLLLEVGFEEFKDHTDERYHTYREQELLNLKDDDDGRRIKPRFILNREHHRALPIRALKWLAGAVVTYGVAALILGGKERLQEDAHVALERVEQVKDTVGEVAGNTREYIAEKVHPAPEPVRRKKVLGLF